MCSRSWFNIFKWEMFLSLEKQLKKQFFSRVIKVASINKFIACLFCILCSVYWSGTMTSPPPPRSKPPFWPLSARYRGWWTAWSSPPAHLTPWWVLAAELRTSTGMHSDQKYGKSIMTSHKISDRDNGAKMLII